MLTPDAHGTVTTAAATGVAGQPSAAAMSGNTVAPSTASRTMSAWPAWRAVSRDEVHEHPPYRPRVEVVGVPRHALRDRHRADRDRRSRAPPTPSPRRASADPDVEQHARRHSVSAATSSGEGEQSASVSPAPIVKPSPYSSSPPDGRSRCATMSIHDCSVTATCLTRPPTVSGLGAAPGRPRLVVGQAVGGEAQHVALLGEVPEQQVVLVGVERSLSGHGVGPSRRGGGRWSPSSSPLRSDPVRYRRCRSDTGSAGNRSHSTRRGRRAPPR